MTATSSCLWKITTVASPLMLHTLHWRRSAPFIIMCNYNATMWVPEEGVTPNVGCAEVSFPRRTELLCDNNVLNVAVERTEWRCCTSCFFKHGFDKFIAGGTRLQCLLFQLYKVHFVTLVSVHSKHWSGINAIKNWKVFYSLASVVDLTYSHAAGQQKNMLSKHAGL